jgi:hypothetical protein
MRENIFYAFIIIIILLYYFGIIIIYESIQNPNYSLNWPSVLKFLTGTHIPDDSLQKFLDAYCTEALLNSDLANQLAACRKSLAEALERIKLLTSDLAAANALITKLRSELAACESGKSGFTTNILDLTPEHVSSSNIVQHNINNNIPYTDYKFGFQNIQGFQNIGDSDNWNFAKTGKNVYNSIKFQIESFLMKLRINGKAYKTHVKYNL